VSLGLSIGLLQVASGSKEAAMRRA